MIRGTVRVWSEDEGWGVIDSEQTPGGCWAHFSTIVTPVLETRPGVTVSAYKSLRAGDAVRFECEAPGQDGYDFRATAVEFIH